MDRLFSLFAATTTGAGGGNLPCHEGSFFGLIPWYHYLNAAGQMDKDCNIINNGSAGFHVLGSNSGFLLIALAVVDDMLRVAGVVAVGFLIYAGIRYTMSQGSPDETAKAQSTLVNALIGLAVAVIAVGLVSFIGHQVGGPTTTPSGSGISVGPLPHTNANADTFKAVLKIVFGLVGALSLLFVTIGGFRYIVSQGEPQAVGKAKSTIIYALIGLVVAVAAEAIVSFVLGRIT
jgi:hypothetical protein